MKQLSSKRKLLYKAELSEIFKKEFIDTLPKEDSLEIFYTSSKKILKIDYIKKNKEDIKNV